MRSEKPGQRCLGVTYRSSFQIKVVDLSLYKKGSRKRKRIPVCQEYEEILLMKDSIASCPIHPILFPRQSSHGPTLSSLVSFPKLACSFLYKSGSLRIYELISTSPVVAVALAFLPAAFLSKIAFLSASSFKLVMTTLEGWIPIWVVAPLDLSLVTRSTWMTHFLR